jgi:tetratricopeptide (TPR) repeat protein
VAFGLVCAAPGAAHASGEPDFDALYSAAKVAYDAGSYAEAAGLLAKAYGVRPEAPLLFNMGRSYELAEMYPEAIDAFTRYVEVAPESEREAARERLYSVKAKFGKGWLTVRATPADSTVQIDEETPVAPPIERLLRPAGTHWVKVTAPGMVSSRTRVDVKAGEETLIDVNLTPALATLDDAVEVEIATGSSPGMSGMELGGWVSLGLGVAFAAGGATLLALGHADADEVDGAETDAGGRVTGLTRVEALDLGDSAEWKSAAGIGGLALGGAGIVTGIVLLVIAPDEADQALWIAPDGARGLAFGGTF